MPVISTLKKYITHGGFFRICYLAVGLIIALKLFSMGAAPLFDVTDARYASIAQQMILTGDWITPYMPITQFPYTGIESFLGKPPLTFWLTALSYKMFGCSAFSARFPNFIESLLICCFAFLTARKFYDKRTAYLTVLILLSSVSLLFESSAVAMDMMVCLTTTGGLWAYLSLVQIQNSPEQQAESAKKIFNKKRVYEILLGLFMGLGMLNKGPISLVLMLGPLLLGVLLDRNYRRLLAPNWMVVAVVTTAIALPWYLAVQKAHSDFFEYFFIHENFYRYLKPEYGDRYGHGHHVPFGMSWLFTLGGFLPWSLLVIPLLPIFLRRVKSNRFKFITHLSSCRLSTIFLLSWAIFTPLFFTLAHSIVFTYFSGTLPALSILCARMISQKLHQLPQSTRNGVLTSFFCIALLVSLGVASWFGFGSESKSLRGLTSVLEKKLPGYQHYKVDALGKPLPYSWFFYTQAAQVDRVNGWPSAQLSLINADKAEERSNGQKCCLVLVRAHHFDQFRQKYPLNVHPQFLAQQGRYAAFLVEAP